MKEVRLGRVAGPFNEVPFDNFIQSPIGLVPQAGGNQTRLIFHLSYDFKDGFRSVNYHTPREKCTVRYRDLDSAVRTYLKLCDEFIAKTEGEENEKEQSRLKKKWKRQFWGHI